MSTHERDIDLLARLRTLGYRSDSIGLGWDLLTFLELYLGNNFILTFRIPDVSYNSRGKK